MSDAIAKIGFVPLVDAAPLIIAKELGFARDRGIEFELHKMPNWSVLRDKLAFGEFDAAHLLAPLPIAMSLGLGASHQALEVLSILSVNGNVIGVSDQLVKKMNPERGFQDAYSTGTALADAMGEKLRLGVPFPFSMHAELVHYWLSRIPKFAGKDISIITIPPPLMSRALAENEIDAFCVGEPWGSYAVNHANASLILPTKAIWTMAPEKVLATRKGWAEDNPTKAKAMLEALMLASKYLSKPENIDTISEILARSEYVDVSTNLIDRALAGRIRLNQAQDFEQVSRFLMFHQNAATFPWRSVAKWIGKQLSIRNGLDVAQSVEIAGQVFRTDLYRKFLSGTGTDFPGASEKVEGYMSTEMPVASLRGEMFLGPDVFFDGEVFDPAEYAG